MTKINLIKRNGVLVPSLPDDEDKLARFKSGEIVRAEITRPRNIFFHRKFFALLRVVLEHTDQFENTDQILHILKLRLGHFETLIEPSTGKQFLKPKSISFASMDEDDFSKFYNETVAVLLQFFLTGWAKEDLEAAYNEVMEFA